MLNNQNMKTRSFSIYHDPSHAWVKVPKKLLNDLDIVDKIKVSSYMRGEYAYLEEDEDLSTFVDAMVEKKSIVVKLNSFYTDKQSRIRKYDNYQVLSDIEKLRISNIRLEMAIKILKKLKTLQIVI